MSETIYTIYEYLTDVPYNFWPWLLLIVAPALVFVIKPERNFWLRFGRLVIAIGAAYVFLNLALGAEHTNGRNAYEACYAQSQFRDMSTERYQECKHHLDNNIVNDSTLAFAYLLGWIPAAGYVGFWELLWRAWYRKKIKQMGKSYKGKWFSNVIILFLIFPGASALYITFPIFYRVILVTKEYF